MRILIVYGTSEGQTEKVARYLADRFSHGGHEVTLIDARSLPADLDMEGQDLTIVAARVHAGSYPRAIESFVRSERNRLQDMPSAFISVSMAAAGHRPGDLERAEDYVERFIAKTGWTPTFVHHAAGARLYAHHGPLTRWILGMIDGNRYDTARDHEFTDWAKLRAFANDVLAGSVPGGRLGSGPDVRAGA
ncbi:protoporphyrinogen oxidase [Arsenicitalea aurantiaca]|uniref:Protoporphyrinogen oxidase n=1 Tax=Arsenicitalea aurantiaca TaxID=1783274 RepID=A0A433XBH5_9HYPH|nr:flavodoxin domain-containing protein [Arsenicitalea aurantiaca]RUT31426.1 protoporphyrinogen oxidase [Arsenicitalea aurantiaca]